MQPITNSIHKEKPLIGVAIEKSGKGMWLASNYGEPHLLLLRFKSVPKKILSSERVVFTSRCLLIDHWCHLKKLRVEEGTNIFPGYYDIEVKGFYVPEKDSIQVRMAHFLGLRKDDDGKTKAFNYQGKVFLYKGTPSSFNKKLKEKERKLQRQTLSFLGENWKSTGP